MKLQRLALLWLVAWCACNALRATSDDHGIISGFVRTGQGAPLADAPVKLTDQQSHTSLTRSGAAGEYRFEGLASGAYSLTVEWNGRTAAASAVVPNVKPASPVKVDLILIESQAAATSESAPTTSQHPQFQASGIRGLIDPGGYSASAGAAATGVVKGMADLKRTDRSFVSSTAKDWPCDLEPGLRKALETNPDQAEANRRFGEFYVAHNQPGKAMPLLKRALQLGGANDDTSRYVAIALLQSGQFEDARRLITTLAERHNEPKLHQLLARTDEGTGNFVAASEQYRIANRAQPGEENLFGVGYELLLAGSREDAVLAFQIGAKQYPDSISMRLGVGAGQFLMGHTSEAVHIFLETTDLAPSDPRTYPFLAAVSGISQDENERVRSSFQRYLELAPNDAAANCFYALSLSRTNAADTAVAGGRIESLLKRAIQLDPNMVEAHLQLANLYLHREKFENAVGEYQVALRLAPDSSEAHYRLATAYRRSGHGHQAGEEMKKFEQAKARREGGSGDSDLDVAQFISVMRSPGELPSQETECNSSPR